MATQRKYFKSAEKPVEPPATGYDCSFGIFVNSAGVEVDKHGVAVGFKDLKRRDNIKWKEALEDNPIQPADLLKAIAFDPRFTLSQRMAAAVSAAPYFTAKKMSVSEEEQFKSPAQRAADIMDAVRAMDSSVGNSATPQPRSRK